LKARPVTLNEEPSIIESESSSYQRPISPLPVTREDIAPSPKAPRGRGGRKKKKHVPNAFYAPDADQIDTLPAPLNANDYPNPPQQIAVPNTGRNAPPENWMDSSSPNRDRS
jgi:hypothetical protein